MSNPILSKNFLADERVLTEAPMTIKGTLNATLMFSLILFASAAFVWIKYMAGFTDLAQMLTVGGAIVGFILALIISFARTVKLVPVYAFCEGLILGGVSAMAEKVYPGIVSQAVLCTMITLCSMLLLYQSGTLRATDKFRRVVFISTISIAGVYLVNFIGSFFGLHVPFLYSSSLIGIGLSVAICIIAALNLIIDFSFIEEAAMRGAPKSYEWYGAFGLLVTIVWLYIEILNLLMKLNRR